MKRAWTTRHAALALGRSGLPVLVLALGLGLVLTGAVACSAPSETGAAGTTSSSSDGAVDVGTGGAVAPPGSGGAADATPGAATGTSPGAMPGATPGAPVDAATSDTKARVEGALNSVTAADRTPDTEQLRLALIDAGFPSDSVEITASRTPTGLDADAVEVAVTAGRNCIVAQLRDGSVTSTVLPLLADGRCLVGTVR